MDRKKAACKNMWSMYNVGKNDGLCVVMISGDSSGKSLNVYMGKGSVDMSLV